MSVIDAVGAHVLGDARFAPFGQMPSARPRRPCSRKKPSDYVRSGKFYFSCEADECLLPQAMKLIGGEDLSEAQLGVL